MARDPFRQRRRGRLVRALWVLAAMVVLALAALAVFGPRIVADRLNPVTAEAEWPVSAEAQALHDRLVIGDLHADALLWDRDLSVRRPEGHVDLPRLDQGNIALQVFTAVTRSPRGQNYAENETEAPDNITPLVISQLRPVQTWFSLKERALDQAARLRHLVEAEPDRLRLIRSRDDLDAVLADRAAGRRVIGAILGMEGAHPLEGDLTNLAVLEGAGYRLIGLTHFFDNELGGSLHGQSQAGLTDFGREVVAEAAQRGMVIDLAHASPQMVRDVLTLPGTRPIISHTGVHGVCNTPRNLPDDLLRAVASSGGIIGIGFWPDVTCNDSPAGIAASIAAATALVGEDHVALGSDWDGSVGMPFDAAGLPALTQALMDEGLNEAQIAKVMGGNMVRYLREVLPRA
ncbi:dipeptidase [Paracoccus chinensis]|uniref:Zn-dependent dipeptidase, dipeptidase homolog n=1 Tax=Paracoccus chinensis TaxID=525640 RepID=A0A1G9ITG6_9RHOB|nr:membrane dipeptidase [Paracoccus chinensis]SDL28598.1 Zn-dependent dipeptidase, dipeptidase homolog [Paracoccus chinensis]